MSIRRQGRALAVVIAVLLLFQGVTRAAPPAPADIVWQHDDTAAFAQAVREKRYVILYLEAVWCHWCHVMDHETYADTGVRATIAAHYVPLRIDQDSRPDLSERYASYGWPATIVFAADGSEIVKRRGFIEKANFRRLLDAIVADPSPEEVAAAAPELPVAAASSLSDAARALLLKNHREQSDTELGGLRMAQKYLDRDETAYAMTLALDGDPGEATIARAALDGALALLDPAWGGVYQYSTNGDWQHPHFEKLGVIQADYLRTWSQASLVFDEPRYRKAAADVRRYVDAFLSADDGGFHVSQDADLRPGEHSAEYFALDDAGRRKQGLPRVDRSEYARETGLMVEAYVAYYEASGDATALARAERAARWLLAQRALADGGFRHSDSDAAGPYQADTLAAGRGFLALYRATADRRWLAHATAAADFIERNFRVQSGYASSAQGKGPIAAVPDVDQNIALARYANALARMSGRPGDRAIAEHALRYLARPDIVSARLSDAGILLADLELHRDPLHLTVLGAKDDAAAQALFARCRAVPGLYRRLEWWDRAEGDLPNPDIQYPKLKKAAAFVCTEGRCSTPLFRPEDVTGFLEESKKK